MYYRAKWRRTRKHSTAEEVISLVHEVRSSMPRIGTRKLYYILAPSLRKLHIGRDKLFSTLNANHMLIKPKCNYRITIDSHHRFKKYKNLIEHMHVKHPEQVWVSDITFIGDRYKSCYLALITDAYSKKIMSYDVSNSLATDGALRALNMAIKQRKYQN